MTTEFVRLEPDLDGRRVPEARARGGPREGVDLRLLRDGAGHRAPPRLGVAARPRDGRARPAGRAGHAPEAGHGERPRRPGGGGRQDREVQPARGARAREGRQRRRLRDRGRRGRRHDRGGHGGRPARWARSRPGPWTSPTPRRPSGPWCASARAGCSSSSSARCSPPPRWAASRRRSPGRWSSPSSCPSSSRAAATPARRPPRSSSAPWPSASCASRTGGASCGARSSPGSSLGGILGLVGFLRISVWSLVAPETYGPHWLPSPSRSALALVGVVLWGTVAGSMLPLVLKRVGLDPAVSSAPVRGHARRRDRPRHLLRGGSPAPARHAPLSGRGRYPPCVHRARARAHRRARSVTALTARRVARV